VNRRLGWQSLLLLLAAILLPLCGALHAATAQPTHPCGATMPPGDAPGDDAQPPCGAALQLPCCDQAATLSTTDPRDAAPAAPTLVALLPPAALQRVVALDASAVRAAARAGPGLSAAIATIVLRI
jgi:hypothetical protein